MRDAIHFTTPIVHHFNPSSRSYFLCFVLNPPCKSVLLKFVSLYFFLFGSSTVLFSHVIVGPLQKDELGWDDQVINLAATAAAQAASTTGEGQNIDERLHALVRRSRVMVFIKGSPSYPRCGFSAKLIAILADKTCKNYGYFDVLSDEAVRQGLKKFSQWPTYPQLYIDGDLIGGLDVVRELDEEGELEELLVAAASSGNNGQN